MSAEKPIIAIIGAGAIGTYYGARLAQHGHDVHFLLRSDFQAVREKGLTVRSCAGDFKIAPEKLNVYRESSAMPPADWVIVTLKTTANDQYQPLIGPLLHQETAILTLQNGLGNEDRLAELFGAHRVLGGMAFTCINRIGPGVIDHSAHGHIRLGEFGGGPSERAARLAGFFNASGVPCDVLPSLKYGRWEKLLWNIPFNGLSTILDQTTDRLLATPQGELLVRRIMEDVIAAARSDGVTLPTELIEVNLDRTREMGPYRTSMHVDRQMGRLLEVEAILGEPMRVANLNGLAVPHLSAIYQLAAMTDAHRRVG